MLKIRLPKHTKILKNSFKINLKKRKKLVNMLAKKLEKQKIMLVKKFKMLNIIQDKKLKKQNNMLLIKLKMPNIMSAKKHKRQKYKQNKKPQTLNTM
jgi:hypothetical protein